MNNLDFSRSFARCNRSVLDDDPGVLVAGLLDQRKELGGIFRSKANTAMRGDTAQTLGVSTLAMSFAANAEADENGRSERANSPANTRFRMIVSPFALLLALLAGNQSKQRNYRVKVKMQYRILCITPNY